VFKVEVSSSKKLYSMKMMLLMFYSEPIKSTKLRVNLFLIEPNKILIGPKSNPILFLFCAFGTREKNPQIFLIFLMGC
jgi:hypothetical protein